MKFNLKSFWLIAAFLVLATCFQNCSGCAESPFSFGSHSDATTSTDSGTGIVGNGEPIDGKPDPGTYYRVIPGFKCKDESTLMGKIVITASGVQASVLDPATCTFAPRSINANEMEFTSQNKNHLGFDSGLYEKVVMSDSSEPRPNLKNFQLTEAWCRGETHKAQGQNLLPTDIVIRQDLSTRLITASILSYQSFGQGSGQGAGVATNFSSIQRAGQIGQLAYTSAEFSLSIDLSSSKSNSDGKSIGRIRAQIDQNFIDEEVTCRTGARLDLLQPLSPPVFRVLGVTGGTDSDIDAYLTDGTAAIVHWQPVNEASSYRVTIRDKNGQNEICAKTFASTASTSQPMSGCLLTANDDYQVSISVTTVYGQTTAAANDRFQFGLRATPCPLGYVRAPAVPPYSTKDFCIAKYEAKQQGPLAISVPTGAPWVNVNRDEALNACQANGIGFDLISNDEWQSAARSIESVSDNWSGGGIGVGALNTGHSDGQIGAPIAGVADDTNACSGTSQSCGLHGFNSQKRTLALSNGSLVWDLAGNVWEWTRDDNFVSYGANDYMDAISNAAPFTNQAKDKFGPAGSYLNLNSITRGGLGYALINFNNGGIVRGSYWDGGAMSGVFRADTSSLLTARTNRTGFRCVYHLP